MVLNDLVSGIVKRNASPADQKAVVGVEKRLESRLLERIALIKGEIEKLKTTNFDAEIRIREEGIVADEQKVAALLVAKSKEKEGWIRSAEGLPEGKKPKVSLRTFGSSKTIVSGKFTEAQINKLRWYNKQISSLLDTIKGAGWWIKTLTRQRKNKEKQIKKLEARVERELKRLARLS